jgi:predicted ATPase
MPVGAIPSSLQASLLARLDRLARVKEVAQVAACIGREFDRAVLAAMTTLPVSPYFPDVTATADHPS